MLCFCFVYIAPVVSNLRSFHHAWFIWLLVEMTAMKSQFISGQDAQKLIFARFKKIYSPLLLIAYLCDLVARYERPINTLLNT